MTHEHLHLFADGLRAMTHEHDHPTGHWPIDPLAIRAHGHVNGRHSHPHDHEGYEPLAEGETRRPIVAVGW